jgi:hypothetical protein
MPKGWIQESKRHSLARQGVKTGRKIRSLRSISDRPTALKRERYRGIDIEFKKSYDRLAGDEVVEAAIIGRNGRRYDVAPGGGFDSKELALKVAKETIDRELRTKKIIPDKLKLHKEIIFAWAEDERGDMFAAESFKIRSKKAEIKKAKTEAELKKIVGSKLYNELTAGAFEDEIEALNLKLGFA